jgi:hypothetical protein
MGARVYKALAVEDFFCMDRMAGFFDQKMIDFCRFPLHVVFAGGFWWLQTQPGPIEIGPWKVPVVISRWSSRCP